MSAIRQDFRVACRRLWRARTFTATATLTLALGIAGMTATFALIHGVLLRPLPVHDQDRLIIAWKEPHASAAVRYPFGDTELDAVGRASQLLENVAGVTRNGAGRTAVIDGDVAAYANVAEVTGGFFDVLGVRAIAGRTLSRTDDNAGAERVVVISSGFWHRQYGGSRDVIGRRVTLDDQRVSIVGVMPGDLDYPTGVDVWRTTTSVPTDGPFGDAVRREVNLVARLRSGATIQQARSEIVALSERIDAGASANALRSLVPVVRPFAEVVVGDVRAPLLALFAAVGLILAIACANVANLLLMRAEARRGEVAIHAALGASRRRIVTPVLFESAVISGIAGIMGLGLASWTIHGLIALMPDGMPRLDTVGLDSVVMAFAIVTTALAGLLSAVAPALLSLGRAARWELREGMGSSSNRASGRRLLVVGQVALAVGIVAAAGLVIQSLVRLQAVDLGLPAERLVLVELHVPQGSLSERHRHGQFLDEVVAGLEGAPMVSSATPVNLAPFSGQGWDVPRFTAEGQDRVQAERNPSLNLESVHPNYFDTLQVPIVRGRAFTPADREGAPAVAIVSDDVADRLWPESDAIGKRFKMGGVDSPGAWYTIVGVAGQTRYRELERQHPTLYLPAAQFQMTATMVVVRTAAPLDLLAPLARDRVQLVDDDVKVMRVVPFAEMLDRPLARPRFNAFVLGVFASVGLLLSAIGLYTVIAAYVRQREREIAIRLAVGATPSRIRSFVLAEALRLATVGAIIGAGVAASASPLMRGLLFGVQPLDVLTIVLAALLFVVVAGLACIAPVRRATRVDPVAILRGQ